MASSVHKTWLRSIFLPILLCKVVYSFGLHEQIWFEIVEPRNISYLFKIRPAKDFGDLMESPLLRIRMVLTDPDHSCSKLLSNGEMLRGNVALIKRGGCSFITKTINAELYGAVAVIITDNKEDGNTASIDMIGDGTDRNELVGIPAFFLMGKDGFMIRRAIEMSGQPFAIINIPVNITIADGVPFNQPPWDYW